MSRRSPAPEMTEIQSDDDIPAFANEDEEDAFWSTHSLGEAMLERFSRNPELADGEWLPPTRPRATPTSVRFDGATVGRLKRLAERRGLRYQTLLKQFVLERLYEEEKREGIIG